MNKVKRVNDNRWTFILFIIVCFLGMIALGQDEIRVYVLAVILYTGLWTIIKALMFDFSKETHMRINYDGVRVGDLFIDSSRHSLFVIRADKFKITDVEYTDIIVYPIHSGSKFIMTIRLKWVLFCYAINNRSIKNDEYE